MVSSTTFTVHTTCPIKPLTSTLWRCTTLRYMAGQSFVSDWTGARVVAGTTSSLNGFKDTVFYIVVDVYFCTGTVVLDQLLDDGVFNGSGDCSSCRGKASSSIEAPVLVFQLLTRHTEQWLVVLLDDHPSPSILFDPVTERSGLSIGPDVTWLLSAKQRSVNSVIGGLLVGYVAVTVIACFVVNEGCCGKQCR